MEEVVHREIIKQEYFFVKQQYSHTYIKKSKNISEILDVTR